MPVILLTICQLASLPPAMPGRNTCGETLLLVSSGCSNDISLFSSMLSPVIILWDTPFWVDQSDWCVILLSFSPLHPSFASFLCTGGGERVRGLSSNSIIRLFPCPLYQAHASCDGMNSLVIMIRINGIHVGDDIASWTCFCMCISFFSLASQAHPWMPL